MTVVPPGQRSQDIELCEKGKTKHEPATAVILCSSHVRARRFFRVIRTPPPPFCGPRCRLRGGRPYSLCLSLHRQPPHHSPLIHTPWSYRSLVRPTSLTLVQGTTKRHMPVFASSRATSD